MLLFWSPRSPYVRRVMIAAHELGIVDDIETRLSINTPAHVDPALVAAAPIGKIPALCMPDGEMIYDSYHIIERLDHIAGGHGLFGTTPERADVLACHLVGDGLLDAAFRWVAESWRPGDGMTAVIRAMQQDKITRCLDWLEARPLRSDKPLLGEISCATALSYLDFRCSALDWSKDHPELANWYAAMAARPSMIATAFVDGPPPATTVGDDTP